MMHMMCDEEEGDCICVCVVIKVLHYAPGEEGKKEAIQVKLYCVTTITPVRNMNLAEFLRINIVENTQIQQQQGVAAAEAMRRDKKDMLHRLLLEQMENSGFFHRGSSRQQQQGGGGEGIPDPLDTLNMQGSDFYPGTYLCVPMVYKRIQHMLRSQGVDSNSIYVEGFSDTIFMVTGKDMLQAKRYNNERALSFYAAVNEYESLKPDERPGFCANLVDSNPPSWPWLGEEEANSRSRKRERRQLLQEEAGEGEEDEDDDERTSEEGDGGDTLHRQLLASYTRKNLMPPIGICLLYNPLMCISPTASRTEWEQQLGAFPAYFIYTMSRSVYSSTRNPLLKPEYFMPEARTMSTHRRWMEHMEDGGNPLAGFYVAGWAHQQFTRVTDACRQNTLVGERTKIQTLRDYMQTCFNMHLGLIDTKSLRSKKIYWSHRLMKDLEMTVHDDLVQLLADELQLGGETFLGKRCTHQHAEALADGGYAQVSLLHVEVEIRTHA